MSQQNKRPPAKGAASKSKKTRARGRTKKGSKVYIPASKIIALCAVVVISCSALLFVTTALDQKQKKAPQKPQQIEQIEKKKQSAKNEVASANEKQKEKTKGTGAQKDNKKDNAKQTQSPSKNTPQKAPQKSPSKANSSSATASSHSSVPQTSESPAKSSSSNQPQTTSKSPANSADASKNTNIAQETKSKITPERTVENAKENQKEQASFQMEKAGKTEIAMKPVEKTPTPEKKDSPKQAADIPEIPLARPGAKLIVIFDDGGQNLKQLEKCLALPFPVTIAILPKLSYSKAAADRTRAAGKDVMLHQPMQAIARADGTVPNPGEGAIKPDMPLYEIERIVRENIAEVGPIVGLNNHEGSAICEDESRIGAVLNVANDSGVFFLDSRTTSQTRVPQAAMSMGYSYYERNVFLDNTKNRADIIAEIMRGVSIANKTGAAIMIGHVWSADVLPPILAELYPLLRAKGYEFTTVPKSGALITP